MGPKQSYHHGNLRVALLLASEALLVEDGVEALSLRKVTQRVGVSHAAVYRHFESKEALLAALAQEGFARLQARLNESTRDEAPPAQLRRCAAAYLSFATENPDLFRVMFGHAVVRKSDYPSLVEAFAATLGPLISCVESCQRARQMSQGAPRELAMLIWSALHGQAALLVDHQLTSLLSSHHAGVEQLAEQLAKSLYRGLAPG